MILLEALDAYLKSESNERDSMASYISSPFDLYSPWGEHSFTGKKISLIVSSNHLNRYGPVQGAATMMAGTLTWARLSMLNRRYTRMVLSDYVISLSETDINYSSSLYLNARDDLSVSIHSDDEIISVEIS